MFKKKYDTKNNNNLPPKKNPKNNNKQTTNKQKIQLKCECSVMCFIIVNVDCLHNIYDDDCPNIVGNRHFFHFISVYVINQLYILILIYSYKNSIVCCI